jgi:hypothetical protein
MDKKIILITFYNRGTISKPIWEVYGHTTTYENYHLETFKLRSQAIEYCHTHCGIPIMQGQGEGLHKIISALSNEK